MQQLRSQVTTTNVARCRHGRRQDVLWGCTFSSKKLTFLSRCPQDKLKLLD